MRRAVLTLSALALLAVGLSACGSGRTTAAAQTSPASPPPPTTSTAQARQARTQTAPAQTDTATQATDTTTTTTTTSTSASGTTTTTTTTTTGPTPAADHPGNTDLSRKPTITAGTGPPPDHLVTRDIVTGDGAVAKPGDTVTVQYVGALYKTGKEFDSTWDRSRLFTFPLGGGQVIPGWDQGIPGMHVGGRRELIIPPSLGYGAKGTPDGTIPPNATLIFIVDLVRIGGASG